MPSLVTQTPYSRSFFFINTQYCRSYIVLIVNAFMVISLYCRTFGVTPMWSKVVKLKVSHRALIFVLRHCFQWISGKLPPWNTWNNIYVVAVVVFQTHVPRLFAWDVSYISNIFIELLPPTWGFKATTNAVHIVETMTLPCTVSPFFASVKLSYFFHIIPLSCYL